MSPNLRLLLAAGSFGAWIALLFLGFAFGGAVHALLLAALVLVPWRAGRPASPTEDS